MSNNPSAVIFGCSGLKLTEEERDFFNSINPVGFIIFSRNIDNPKQVKSLCEELRCCTDREDTPILIDQEGGRVARLQPPYWPVFPPAKVFGDLYKNDQNRASEDCFKNFFEIGNELRKIGVNVDCAPVLDLPVPEANAKIVGDRPFSTDKNVISILGKIASEALLKSGVLPIMKHIPGHGRAKTDSHFELPIVDVDENVLLETDFEPFKNLSKFVPWAMTAHILYPSIDPIYPASLSKKIIKGYIREKIGFEGFLICDDLSMKALKGDFSLLTQSVLDAGCDAVLHCNGDMKEMLQIAKSIRPLSIESMKRYIRGQNMLKLAVKE
ncbi:MAG: beta-N-acetylhexosaminidase [Alphaproteobacteria bacterium]|nr:beta-N-acetylhexosaminidase [Alphaproteobacteria bacterium]